MIEVDDDLVREHALLKPTNQLESLIWTECDLRSQESVV